MNHKYNVEIILQQYFLLHFHHMLNSLAIEPLSHPLFESNALLHRQAN